MKIYIKIFVCSFVFNYIVIALVPTELPVVRRHKLSIYLPVQSGNGQRQGSASPNSCSCDVWWNENPFQFFTSFNVS